MSPLATAWRLAFAAVLTASASNAQALIPSQAANAGLDWRRLGQTSINLQLAGAATGPVDAVWYSAAGGHLYARTAGGQVFDTADFEKWTRSDAVRGDAPEALKPIRVPEANARVIEAPGDSRRAWSLGRNVFVSEDGGATWSNVSANRGEPVIGAGQRDVAVSPEDPNTIAVANEFGVWQTRDGGQSWAGLNDNLPNLPLARIVSMKRGAWRVALTDGRTLTLPDSRGAWQAVAGESVFAAEAREKQRAGKALSAEITAWARSGDLAYAGSSDGRVWVSRDRGTNWIAPQNAGRGAVERFYVDADAPRAALAIVSGPGAHLARTVNAGAVWDDVSGNLADVAIRGATADRSSGTVYAATDRGVFAAHVDLNAFTPASSWVPLTGSLPTTRVVDIAMDATTGQLYAALDGYGVYTAAAPVRTGSFRVLNAADLSTRAAAPGSVISVVGGRVSTARAGDLKFPVLAAGTTESQLQVPFEAAAPGADLAIETAGGSTTLPIAIHAVSPAIFVDPDGSPFLVDAETGLVVDPTSMVHSRSRLQMMLTGLGRVQPDWPTGRPAPAQNPPVVAAGIQAYLDGIPLEVTKATLAPGYIGYYEVEITLPAVLNAGPAELYITADGQESNRVRIVLDAQ